jgi:hypothetical protein
MDVTPSDANTEMVAFESESERLRWLPINIAAQSGYLRLEAGRLTFRTDFRERIVFDIPANEIHSVAPMTSMGLHFWHDTTRYRFSTGVAVPASHPVTGSDLGNVVARAAALPAALAHDTDRKLENRAWLDLLSEHACEPPPGLRVRKPWPRWTWAVGVLLAAAVLIGGIVAVTLATL